METVPKSDQQILAGSRSWSATPWDYSSMRFMQFADDGSGLLVYGYGQTIYAKINIRFTLEPDREIAIEYLASPPYQRFAGFSPGNDSNVKTLQYTLSEYADTITESVTGADFSFKWLLTVNDCPFPESLAFPYGRPVDFYGYREDVRSQKAK